MSKENNIGAYGAKYSFYDINTFLEDPLRSEFGSVWTSHKSDRPPSFGTQTTPRFDIEYGPIVATKADFPPYVAHHQSVKLRAKSNTYKDDDCIDCGFHDDVRAALTINGAIPSEWADTPTADILSLYPDIVHYSNTIRGMTYEEQVATDRNSSGDRRSSATGMTYEEQVAAGIGDRRSSATGMTYEEQVAAGIGARRSSATGMTYEEQVAADRNSSGERGSSAAGDHNFDLPSACWHDISTPLNEHCVSVVAYSRAKSRVDQAMANGYVSFEYGDYVKTLEEVMINLDEKDIPNMYALLYGMRPADIKSTETYFFNQALDYLKGNIDCAIEEVIRRMSTGFTDFLVSAENVDASKKMHAYKDFFSLRAETNFSTSKHAEFADKLKSVNLDCRLLRWMVETRMDSDLVPTDAVFNKFEENSAKVSMENVASNGSLNVRTYDLFKWTGAYDYSGEDINSIPDPVPSTMGFVGENDSSTRLAKIGDGEDPLAAQVKFSQLVFTNQLRTALGNYNKSFQNVVSGEKPYSETLAYKISKYKKSSFSTTNQLDIVQGIINNGTEAIQNVWLANSSESEAVEYVDTQTKYNEGYVFVIWAYNLVLGTRYFYSNIRTSESDSVYAVGKLSNEGLFLGATTDSDLPDAGWTIGETTMPDSPDDAPSEFYQFTTSESLTINVEDDCEAAFVATTMPMAVIKEVPFFIWTGSIMDKPPVSPDVSIVPMCDSYNVLMLLNNSAGTIFTNPILLNTGEQEIFDDIKTSQGLYTDLVEFRSDNPLDSYEVYRTTEMPNSYSDFSDNLLTTISTILDEASGARSDSTSYTDTLEPNIKYYYTFRSTDIHGHFSNPGPVFEIELVDDGESVLPSIQVIDMEEENHRDSSIPMKNILHIVPRITQAVVNEGASNLTGDTATVVSKSSKPILGVEDTTPWGKTFKVRLVSRQTKRKFDINVTFDTEYADKREQLIMTRPCDQEFIATTADEINTLIAGTADASVSTEEASVSSRGTETTATTRGTLSDGPGQDSGRGRAMSPDDPMNRGDTRTTTTTVDRNASSSRDTINPGRGDGY